MKPFEKWIEEVASLTRPREIHICDGSEEEAVWMIKKGMEEERINGKPVFYELNQKTWPTAYLHRSHPTDVARTEHLTFVCHPEKEMAGPNNNWMDPAEAKRILTELSKGCMQGRTMYVLPYAMGNLDSPFCKLCIQVTDISYVAVSMRIMTHMGKDVLDRIGYRDDFVKGLHSIGDLDPTRRYIIHFPQENLVWSIGSGYGGNALLGKKCFSLRIASWLGFKEGWLAEHMLMIGVEDPDGKIYYICGAFPSACGKTNLALLESPLPGYKVWTLGDDIAWLRVGEDGYLYAMNPETGYFGVAPGTSWNTNPNMMRTLKAAKFFPTLFTNVALDPDKNEPFWEGLGDFPQRLLDWQGNPWDSSKPFAAHPNSRFTVSIFNTPALSPEFFNPKGVPVSAIIVGVRRSDTIPLVVEAFDWKHGVFLGARMGSEITAAAQDLKTGTVRRDPFAMLPFCGYNMADYFSHWLSIGKRLRYPPKIFAVNWFRKSRDGRYLWPGFGENIRILKWIIDRVNGKVEARETPIGLIPYPKDISIEGLNIKEEDLEEALHVDKEEWKKEVEEIKKFFSLFGERLPLELYEELTKLENEIKR